MSKSIPIKSLIDAATKMAVKRGTVDVVFVSHETVRNFLAAQAPSLHLLYSAGWLAGLTVNGITPPKVR